jgi:hypothetical protein
MLTVEKKIKVTQQDIDDIMCAALEGGICYWCGRAEVVGEYLGEYASEQISRGGTLKLYDCEDMNEVYELDRGKLLKGIKKAFEEGYYSEYEWCNGTVIDTCQVDADVADVIVQIAVFDEVVYG